MTRQELHAISRALKNLERVGAVRLTDEEVERRNTCISSTIGWRSRKACNLSAMRGQVIAVLDHDLVCVLWNHDGKKREAWEIPARLECVDPSAGE